MYRKIENYIKDYLLSNDERILCIDGARQIGKTFVVSKVINELFDNCIELNFDEDNRGDKEFADIKNVNDFYIQLSIKYGDKMGDTTNTVVFFDEIQTYPQFFSMLKQLAQDGRFKYICSGSLLGLTLQNGMNGLTPMGSITEKHMYPMDFEEFLIANGVGKEVLNYLEDCYKNKKTVKESVHNSIMSYFLSYLYVGGLPAAVKEFVESKNVMKIKEIQKDIYSFYSQDASKYDFEHKLNIKRVHETLLSNIDSKVKRVQFTYIEDKENARFLTYKDEFEYLINSGIALICKALSEPKFPLIQSTSKNLFKLYFNDVGILSYLLYKNNINAILKSKTGINLGAVYETVVAQELVAHGHDLFYYDRKKVGEVDFLVNDYGNLCVLPIEIKSAKEGYSYRAMPKLLDTEGYRMQEGLVLSNDNEVKINGKIIHMPIYNIMFI